MQQLLFEDPQPLVERLGQDFFRSLPETPGVYLMRDSSDIILYVGKARNLRQRLRSYRVANPDRLPRRHLRLLRAVARIEIQEAPDESSALAREAELIRTLKPCFNRAGTWTGPPRFLAWRLTRAGLELAVTSAPDPAWRSHGGLGAGARYMRIALVRLLWFALCPAREFSQMPAGWFRGSFGETVTLPFPDQEEASLLEVSGQLERLFAGQTDRFSEWLRGKLTPETPIFEKAVLENDLERLNDTVGCDTHSGPTEEPSPR